MIALMLALTGTQLNCARTLKSHSSLLCRVVLTITLALPLRLFVSLCLNLEAVG